MAHKEPVLLITLNAHGPTQKGYTDKRIKAIHKLLLETKPSVGFTQEFKWKKGLHSVEWEKREVYVPMQYEYHGHPEAGFIFKTDKVKFERMDNLATVRQLYWRMYHRSEHKVNFFEISRLCVFKVKLLDWKYEVLCASWHGPKRATNDKKKIMCGTMIDFLLKLKAKTQNLPLVIGGDFNLSAEILKEKHSKCLQLQAVDKGSPIIIFLWDRDFGKRFLMSKVDTIMMGEGFDHPYLIFEVEPNVECVDVEGSPKDAKPSEKGQSTELKAQLNDLKQKLKDSHERQSELWAELKLCNEQSNSYRDQIRQLENELVRVSNAVSDDAKLNTTENKITSVTSKLKNEITSGKKTKAVEKSSISDTSQESTPTTALPPSAKTRDTTTTAVEIDHQHRSCMDLTIRDQHQAKETEDKSSQEVWKHSHHTDLTVMMIREEQGCKQQATVDVDDPYCPVKPEFEPETMLSLVELVLTTSSATASFKAPSALYEATLKYDSGKDHVLFEHLQWCIYNLPDWTGHQPEEKAAKMTGKAFETRRRTLAQVLGIKPSVIIATKTWVMMTCKVNGCKQQYSSKRGLKNHLATIHGKMSVMCVLCEGNQVFRDPNTLHRHIQDKHRQAFKMLDRDFASDSNCFWMSMDPAVFIQGISTPSLKSDLTRYTQYLVIEHARTEANSFRSALEWKEGWEHALQAMNKQANLHVDDPYRPGKPEFEPETMQCFLKHAASRTSFEP